ncbi:MAG: hypothetical protein JWR22_335 [Herminiimonas sp.]|nr:hypothetical protein [Herminiimonas sp.]
MKTFLQSLALSLLLMCGTGYAQSPGAATPDKSSGTPPATSSSKAKSKATPAASESTSESKDKKTSKAKDKTAATGGGAGKVWVNTDSKVYHCPGTRYYGKTKTGEYMAESEAKSKGNRADHNKACT